MRLTSDEQRDRAERLALNMRDQLQGLDQLEQDAKRFLGNDEAFTAEIEGIRSGRRFIDPAELTHFLEETLRRHFPGARLQTDGAREDHWLLRVDTQLRQYLLAFVRSREERLRAGRLPALLEQGVPIELTFNMELANRNRELEFLTPRHPLVRAALAHQQQHLQAGAGSAKINLRGGAEPGRYVFLVYVFEASGLHRGPRLAAVTARVASASIEADLGATLLLRIASGEMLEVEEPDGPSEETLVDRALRSAEEEAGRQREELERRLARESEELVDLRLTAIREHTRIKVARIERLLQDHPTLPPSIVKMRRGEITNLQERQSVRAGELENSRKTSVGMTLVAGGILDVREYGSCCAALASMLGPWSMSGLGQRSSPGSSALGERSWTICCTTRLTSGVGMSNSCPTWTSCLSSRRPTVHSRLSS